MNAASRDTSEPAIRYGSSSVVTFATPSRYPVHPVSDVGDRRARGAVPQRPVQVAEGDREAERTAGGLAVEVHLLQRRVDPAHDGDQRGRGDEQDEGHRGTPGQPSE